MALRASFFGLNHAPPAPPPAAPTGLSATPTGTNKSQVLVGWNASVGATGYIVEHSTNGSTWVEIADTASTSHTHTPTYGVATHHYRVRAYNGQGEGANAATSIAGILVYTVAVYRGENLNDSVGSNHLSQGGSVPFVMGKLGNAFDIDASNYPYITDSALLRLGGSFTIAVWFMRDVAVDYQTIVQKSTSFPNESDYEIFVTGTDIYLYLGTGSGSTVVSKSGTFSTGTWYCMVATYDAVTNQMTMSVNAGTRATNTFSGSRYGSSSDLRLGHTTLGGPSNLDGKLDTLVLAGRPWSEDEEDYFYNGGAGIDYPFQ